MKENFFLSLLFGFWMLPFKAQEISMHFPAFAGKSYDLILFQGSRSVKALEGVIPGDGKFVLRIPKEYAPYQGMCRWLLTNSKEGGGLDMSIPGYGFSVSCLSSRPNSENIIFEGYDPVNMLNTLNQKQQSIIDKYQLMSRGIDLYGSESSFYGIFQKELEIQKKDFDSFFVGLKSNPNPVALYLPIINISKGVPPHLERDYIKGTQSIVSYITDELNLDALYTSGYWSAVLDTWVQIETQSDHRDEELVKSFRKLSGRISDPERYTDFVTVITQSLTRYGKEKEIILISPDVLKSGKISEYSGVLSIYQTALIGQPAPDLETTIGNKATSRLVSKDFTAGGYNKAVLLFYESGCGACQELLEKLPGQYESLKKKGVRIIAVSGDQDENLFVATSKSFPWKDTSCDFQHWKGKNFIRYAVSATPTAFIINKQGIIEARVSNLDEILKKINP
jgi:peroxiredoxin